MRRDWFDIRLPSGTGEYSGFRDSIELCVSEGFFDRLCGIFRCRGAPLLLKQCSAVHSFGLAKPIFIVFLDSDLVVLCSPRLLRPWSIARFRGAAHVLELDVFSEFAPGDRLKLRNSDI